MATPSVMSPTSLPEEERRMMLTAFARRARSVTSSAAAKAACLCGIVMVQPTQFSVALITSKKLPTRSGRTSIGTTTASIPRSPNQRFMGPGVLTCSIGCPISGMTRVLPVTAGFRGIRNRGHQGLLPFEMRTIEGFVMRVGAQLPRHALSSASGFSQLSLSAIGIASIKTSAIDNLMLFFGDHARRRFTP